MFLQQINTLATLYLTKWVNTGDKILDNSLIALAVCIISTFLFHFVEQWKTYYNFVIYYAYRMYNNPLATRNVPYMINYLAFETMAAFNDQTRNTYVWINPVRLNDMLRPHGISVSIDDLKKYMKQLVDTNNKSMMIDNTGHYLGYYKERIYPIAVGRYGNVIFYETSDPHLRSYGGWGSDTEHILQHIYKYLVETAVLDRSRINSDEIYVPKYVKKNASSPDIELEMKSIGKINKKKTFDTLYYPQKSELMMLLSRFQNGAMYPPHIPMDNKLGILLYGPPGTGKTGTISAVANMLGRSIVVINFANITTCKQLDDILDPEKYTRHVYVFDEFDCVLDVIGRGTAPAANASKGSSMDWGSALLFADDAERKNILAEMKEGRSRKDDTPIDMAYLLQKLDGLESAEGRVIIATTNNPDKINPALLRPGRFDIKICLGPATQEMVVDILTNFFQGDEKVRTQIAAADLPGGVFSPLELINMAIQTPDCEKLLAKLLSAATAKHERAATDQNAAT